MSRACMHIGCDEKVSDVKNDKGCARCSTAYCFLHLSYPKTSPIRAICPGCQNELTAMFLTEEAFVECMVCFNPLLVVADPDQHLAICDCCKTLSGQDATLLNLR